ncbi:major facilitator superfamily domain-containing protein [Zopfochytrium polystomum]|nr:major facilitator superfamily domain-containing protein [Zopfochytrium polystomum]
MTTFSDEEQAIVSTGVEAPQSTKLAVDDDFIKVPLGRVQFTIVFFGLLVAVLQAALDQTIVSTILKVVVADLGKQELFSWVGSAYLITGTSFSLLYGRMSDIFGRKWVFVIAIALFEVGSAICGVANTMELLIVGRAVAGVGGGGIFSMVLIIVTDIVSFGDRGKYQGVIGAGYALASVIGPLIGALALVSPATGSVADKIRQIDFLGTGLIFFGVTCFVTPLQLAGSTWEWNSPQTITLLVVAALILVAFIYVEMKLARTPIVPPAMFTTQNVHAFLVIAFCVGAIFFDSVYYIGLFFQVNYGVSATSAGLSTIPLVLGVTSLAIASGQIVSRVGGFHTFLFVGGTFSTAGLVATSFLTPSATLAARVCFLLLLGLGLGCLIQIRIIGLQASVDPSKIAVVTAVSQLMQSLGGAVGIAVTGTALNNLLSAQIDARPALLSVLGASSALSAIPRSEVVALREALGAAAAEGAVPGAAEALAELLDSFTVAYADVFRLHVVFSGLILVAAMFVRRSHIRGARGSRGLSNA